MPRLDQRIALVTGAGNGLGHAIAARLAEDGAHVWLTDVDGEAADRAATALAAAGRAVSAAPLDVTRGMNSRRSWPMTSFVGSIELKSPSCGIEPSRTVAYKPLLDDALAQSSHSPEACVILQRPQLTADMGALDHDWAELVANAEPAGCVDVQATDPLYILYTSGTTGKPKGIVHAHRYILAHEEFVYCHDIRDGERFHGMGEWAWAAGISPLLGPWRLGAVQCVYQREGGFDPPKQLDFLSRHEVTNVFTTPTAMRAMMAIEAAGEKYPQKFRIVCSAGEPLNPEAIRWFREQYGITVLDYYGLTESYPLCANFPFMEVREGSMGRVMPGWDVQILDEDENPVEQGERGEICLRARSNPHYPLGYWRMEDASEETFGGEWFHSKDAATQDEDGYVWYAGRADDVIIAAGYRIGPFEVESACLEHDAVAEAAAVASPDEVKGNVVKAFIVLADGHEGSDDLAADIRKFVRERLSAYAYPRKVEFVTELPKTLTGKIRRIELREQEREAAEAGT